MEWNKLRVAHYPGEIMFARRTLLQVATKLAIGLGALFLVGVLLAAIPNHRAPVVTGVSAEPAQETQGMEHSSVKGMNMDDVKANAKDAVPDMAHRHHGDSAPMHITAPKVSHSAQ
jgi:hypothetical protein